jgi:hypothetical protein
MPKRSGIELITTWPSVIGLLPPALLGALLVTGPSRAQADEVCLKCPPPAPGFSGFVTHKAIGPEASLLKGEFVLNKNEIVDHKLIAPLAKHKLDFLEQDPSAFVDGPILE